MCSFGQLEFVDAAMLLRKYSCLFMFTSFYSEQAALYNTNAVEKSVFLLCIQHFQIDNFSLDDKDTNTVTQGAA